MSRTAGPKATARRTTSILPSLSQASSTMKPSAAMTVDNAGVEGGAVEVSDQILGTIFNRDPNAHRQPRDGAELRHVAERDQAPLVHDRDAVGLSSSSVRAWEDSSTVAPASRRSDTMA